MLMNDNNLQRSVHIGEEQDADHEGINVNVRALQ